MTTRTVEVWSPEAHAAVTAEVDDDRPVGPHLLANALIRCVKCDGICYRAARVIHHRQKMTVADIANLDGSVVTEMALRCPTCGPFLGIQMMGPMLALLTGPFGETK